MLSVLNNTVVLFTLFVTASIARRGTVAERRGRETNTGLLGKRECLARKDNYFGRGEYCLYKNKEFSEVSGKE
jgi:hypothetical protein